MERPRILKSLPRRRERLAGISRDPSMERTRLRRRTVEEPRRSRTWVPPHRNLTLQLGELPSSPFCPQVDQLVVIRCSVLNRKLFIGGITGDTQETDLKDYFQSFGALTDVVVMRGFTPCSDCTPALLFSLLTFPDKITGRGRGFGFVTFEDPAVVERILGGKHELKGRTVRLALPELRCVAEFWGFDFERTYR